MITTLHLGLSYACNLNCAHCYVRRKKDILSVEQYKQLIQILSEHGLMVIMYTYGEPLLSDKLPAVASYAASLGISQTVLTNGWFLSEQTLQQLDACGVNCYNISLDSPCESIHDSNRGRAGAYQRAREALRLLVRLGKNVGIGYTVTEYNACGTDEIMKIAEEEGIRRVSFLAERSCGRISNVLSDDYLAVFRRAVTGNTGNIRCFFHDYRLLPELIRLNSIVALDEDEFSRWYQMNSCHAPYTISVEPNGDIYRCNMCPNHVRSLAEDSDFCRVINNMLGEEDESFICRPVLP